MATTATATRSTACPMGDWSSGAVTAARTGIPAMATPVTAIRDTAIAPRPTAIPAMARPAMAGIRVIRGRRAGRIDHRRPIRARAGTTGGLRSRSAVIRAAAPVAASFARRAARPSKLRPGASPPRSSPDSSVNKPLASRSRAAQASLCSARRGINGSPLFRPRAGVALCAPRALRKNEGPDVPRHPTPPLPRDVLAGPCSNTGGANAPVIPSAWIYKQAPCQRFFPV